MATATLSPRDIPTPSESSYSPLKTMPSIQEEVEANQHILRNRLAGAITKPPPNVSTSSLPTVPLIDLAPSFTGDLTSRKAVASRIREACLTTGFFQISNHGIPTSASDGILRQAERFFHDLTTEQKNALHIQNSPLFRGFEPPEYSYVNPDDNGGAAPRPETKEGFNWGYESSLNPNGGDGAYVELDGLPPAPGRSNLWPAEEDLPGFKAEVATYYGEVLRLARHLFRLFALSLELDDEYFDALTTHPGGIGRLLYYPAQPASLCEKKDVEEEEQQGKLGLGAHTDYECFTLLLSSSNPGLEILFPPSPLTNDAPIWRPCPVRPGTLTVNVADFLMRWTNGLYKSTIHRVVSKPGTGERYSVPFFFSINYDSEVGPLPERVVGESRYQPMKAGQYVLERLRATTK